MNFSRNRSDEGHVAVARPAIVAVSTVLLTLATVAGCGKTESQATSDSSSSATTEQAQSAVIDDAGGGEVQSIGGPGNPGGGPPEGALGSRSNRLNLDAVLQNPLGLGVLAVQSTNICDNEDVKTYRKQFYRLGVPGWYYDAYMTGPEPDTMFTLVCSMPAGTIWPMTNGPGKDGISVACPDHSPNARKGTGVVYFAVNRTRNQAGNMTQTAGGYGTNGDGLWNYRFHNWNTSIDVTPTIALICMD